MRVPVHAFFQYPSVSDQAPPAPSLLPLPLALDHVLCHFSLSSPSPRHFCRLSSYIASADLCNYVSIHCNVAVPSRLPPVPLPRAHGIFKLQTTMPMCPGKRR